ncbi:hypothetical protein [Streptomyces sp. NBC_00989]|uniref:hypothetical protein n=1 Tax=Streptomyces sp. NBC_00989 TaxID=2903705 RepID=UPI00386DB23B|nr:hypothetical protein OG714_47035 [Streptomyces sp. NBC_00989]
MTHDPEHDAGDNAATPPMPDHAPEWEVLTGPGGAERDRGIDRLWRQRSRRSRAVIAVATVAVLALGGTVAYAATSGSSGSDAVPAAAGSPSGTPSPGGPGFRHGGGGGFGLGGAAVHGEATVKDNATGKWVVRIWQRGTVTKVDGDQVTVKSDDGTSWTWTVGSDATAKGAALKKGDTASLTGTRSDTDTRTADRAFTGTFDHKGPSDGRGGPGDRGPGPWGRGNGGPSAVPSPSGSDATT